MRSPRRAGHGQVQPQKRNEERPIDGQSLGNGTAFSAVAPPQRPVCDAHQSTNIRERYSDHVPPGPNIWTLNIQPLGQFRPHLAFCQPDPHCLASVARLPHTVTRVTLRGGFHGPLRPALGPDRHRELFVLAKYANPAIVRQGLPQAFFNLALALTRSVVSKPSLKVP
jgi:hypothetical protein